MNRRLPVPNDPPRWRIVADAAFVAAMFVVAFVLFYCEAAP